VEVRNVHHSLRHENEEVLGHGGNTSFDGGVVESRLLFGVLNVLGLVRLQE